MKARLLVAAAVISMTGCAVDERENAPAGGDHPQPGKALVYFYRPSHFYGSSRRIQISDRSRPIGDLDNGTYFACQVSPGDHRFNGNDQPEDSVHVWLVAGRTYYFRSSIKPGATSPYYPVENMADLSGLPEGLKRVR
jgi:hypothetical protein